MPKNILTDTTAEEYVVTVLGPKIESFPETIREVIAKTPCRPPDTGEIENRLAESCADAVREAVLSEPLTIEVNHTVQLEEDTRHTVQKSAQEISHIAESLGVAPLTVWQKRLLKITSVGTGVLALTIVIFSFIYFNSAPYWGMRYHKACNHPFQTKEVFLDRRDVAFKDVVDMFNKGKAEKKTMKSRIRMAEQAVAIEQRDKKGGKSREKGE